MAVSKITPEDARELYEDTMKRGETWYAAVGLLVKMNVHKSLGMDRREMIASFGARINKTEAREAVLALHAQGLSTQAIADVLSLSPAMTVQPILVEAGLVAPTPKQIAAPRGDSAKQTTARRGDIDIPDADVVEDDPEKERLQAEVENLREAEMLARQDAIAVEARLKDANAADRKKLGEELKRIQRAEAQARQDLKDAEQEFQEAVEAKVEERVGQELRAVKAQAEETQRELARLRQVEAEELRDTKATLAELRKKQADQVRAEVDKLREQDRNKREGKSKADREREAKEAEAREETFDSQLVPMWIGEIVEYLGAATDTLEHAMSKGIKPEHVARIKGALDPFLNELTVASAAVGEDSLR